MKRHLLTDILRGELGFTGFVVSDFQSEKELVAHGYVEDGGGCRHQGFVRRMRLSIQSGIYAKYIPALVRSGRLSQTVVDEAVRRYCVSSRRSACLTILTDL